MHLKTICLFLILLISLTACIHRRLPPPPDLTTQLRSEGVQIIVLGSDLKVIIGTDRFFHRVNTARIEQNHISTLNKIAGLFKLHGRDLIIVSGHTDNVGTDKAKFKRSYLMANTVAAYLWSAGIPLRNIIVIGCGDTEPVSSNKTVNGSAANRRVEIESGPEAFYQFFVAKPPYIPS